MSERRRYDPRLGDEDDDPQTLRTPPNSPPRTPKHVHIQIPDDAPTPEKSREGPAVRPPQPLFTRVVQLLPFNLAWVPANFTWSKWKPALRCAVVCWVSALLMIIPQTMQAMGQVRICAVFFSLSKLTVSRYTTGKLSYPNL